MKAFLALFVLILTIVSTTFAGKCDPPNCKDPVNQGLKFPHVDPVKYYLCQYNELHERFCGAGFAFHALRRQCVHSSVWEDYCGKK
uniref:CSON001416 protein n=1 Tax=Culicoides sonorensis TaxID=179676 RepID=A0A336MHB9_CULSO